MIYAKTSYELILQKKFTESIIIDNKKLIRIGMPVTGLLWPHFWPVQGQNVCNQLEKLNKSIKCFALHTKMYMYC